MLKNFLLRLGPVIAVIRHYIPLAAVNVVKDAVLEAYRREDWDKGEKTAFVIAKVREFAAATPTLGDDLLVEMYAMYYLRKHALRVEQTKVLPASGLYNRYLDAYPDKTKLEAGDRIYKVPPPPISPVLPEAWWVEPAGGGEPVPPGAEFLETMA
jgi:hypothetical protein